MSLSISGWRLYERDLLSYSLQELTGLVVNAPNMDEAWHDYLLASFFLALVG